MPAQITPANVSRLERAWTSHNGEQVSNADYNGQKITTFEATPLVVNNSESSTRKPPVPSGASTPGAASPSGPAMPPTRRAFSLAHRMAE